MKERLLGFTFCGVFLVFGISFAADKIHAGLFADSLWFPTYWYIPYMIMPAAALLALGWGFGLFRPKGPRWADAVALLVTGLLIYLTLGAAYSCWQYCF
jgi:hypothetical protein